MPVLTCFHQPLKNKFRCTTHFKTEHNPCSMRFGLFFLFVPSVILLWGGEVHKDVQQNKLFLQFDKRDQKLAYESTMFRTDCYLQFTTNPLNPRLEQFFRGNSEHMAYFRTDYEWKFSEECSLFFSSEQFEQFHSALRRTLRDSVTHSQDFGAFFIQPRAAL